MGEGLKMWKWGNVWKISMFKLVILEILWEEVVFFPFTPENHLVQKYDKSFWYYQYIYYPDQGVSFGFLIFLPAVGRISKLNSPAKLDSIIGNIQYRFQK